ncbi:MAG: DUF2490 domain-containing protein [Chitinophagaceae bacterium]|nr:DUF2490 domain-containing protein [Chitinophagaceae bacterium]
MKFASGQSLTTQGLFWYGYNLSIQSKKNWSLLNEVEGRNFMEDMGWHQRLVRTSLNLHSVSPGWNIGGGLAFFDNISNMPGAAKQRNHEIRPHLQAVFKYQIRRFSFEQRFRNEFRFFKNIVSQNGNHVDSYHFRHVRFRYRYLVYYHPVKGESSERFSLKAGQELLLKIAQSDNGSVLDQNRFYAGITYSVVPGFQMEASYIHLIQPGNLNRHFQRHIFRILLIHKINFNHDTHDKSN